MRWCLALLLALYAQAASEVAITAELHHHLIFANAHVRVFSVDVPPHSATLMHRHAHDYFYIVLGATDVSNEVAGRPAVELKLADGEVRFSPGPFAHLMRTSDQAFRNVTVELLEDGKLRHSTAKWDEERGLDILQGGTKEVLFVKDGVRASEFELQLGGAVPSEPRARPLLLVAVNDLDVFQQDPRTHGPPEPMPSPKHFRSGETEWLPLGFRQPVVNAGKQAAKFVTLEFPQKSPPKPEPTR